MISRLQTTVRGPDGVHHYHQHHRSSGRRRRAGAGWAGFVVCCFPWGAAAQAAWHSSQSNLPSRRRVCGVGTLLQREVNKPPCTCVVCWLCQCARVLCLLCQPGSGTGERDSTRKRTCLHATFSPFRSSRTFLFEKPSRCQNNPRIPILATMGNLIFLLFFARFGREHETRNVANSALRGF